MHFSNLHISYHLTLSCSSSRDHMSWALRQRLQATSQPLDRSSYVHPTPSQRASTRLGCSRGSSSTRSANPTQRQHDQCVERVRGVVPNVVQVEPIMGNPELRQGIRESMPPQRWPPPCDDDQQVCICWACGCPAWPPRVRRSRYRHPAAG